MASQGTPLAQHHGFWARAQRQLQSHAVRRFRKLPVCQASKEEMLARIARAKQYKEPSAPPAAAPEPEPQKAPPTPPSTTQQPSGASRMGVLGFAEDDAPPEQQEEQQQETTKREWTTGKYIPVPEVSELFSTAPKRSGTGSSAEPADWLKGVLADQGPVQDPNVRMEVFTEAKEERMRQRGADIITIDPSYRPDLNYSDAEPSSNTETGASSSDTSADSAESSGSSEQEGKYKPKVTTWGVFPRPKNISQAFGGGRNLQPGQELETKEQEAARKKEYQAMLSQ
jgi:hypothetical protein